MKNQLKNKLEQLLKERENVLIQMQKLRNDYEICRDKVLELNGSIQVTEELLRTAGDNEDDSKCEATSGSDVNS